MILESQMEKHVGNSFFCGVVLSERMRYAINLFLENAKKKSGSKALFYSWHFYFQYSTTSQLVLLSST